MPAESFCSVVRCPDIAETNKRVLALTLAARLAFSRKIRLELDKKSTVCLFGDFWSELANNRSVDGVKRLRVVCFEVVPRYYEPVVKPAARD